MPYTTDLAYVSSKSRVISDAVADYSPTHWLANTPAAKAASKAAAKTVAVAAAAAAKSAGQTVKPSSKRVSAPNPAACKTNPEGNSENEDNDKNDDDDEALVSEDDSLGRDEVGGVSPLMKTPRRGGASIPSVSSTGAFAGKKRPTPPSKKALVDDPDNDETTDQLRDEQTDSSDGPVRSRRTAGKPPPLCLPSVRDGDQQDNIMDTESSELFASQCKK